MHAKQLVNMLSWLARVGLLVLLTIGPTPAKAGIRDKQDGKLSGLAVQNAAANALNPANQPPVAVDDNGQGFFTFNHRAFTTGNVLSNDSNPSGNPIFVESFDTSGTKGQVTLANPWQNGRLDTDFGVGGKTTTVVGGTAIGMSSILQPDGKIILTGSNMDTDFIVARYNPDGKLDTSFGNGGIVNTDVAGLAVPRDIALQSDGKIIVVGGSDDFVLVRYKPNGSLDTSFGSGGMAYTDFGGSDIGNAVVIQTNGKIVVAGNTQNSFNDFAIARYKTDGSLDTTFGSGGKVITPFGYRPLGEESDDMAYGAVLQSDGKIIVVGWTNLHNDEECALVRYNTNGSLDSTFGSNGISLKLIHDGVEAQSVILQNDGKIVIAGHIMSGYTHGFAVVRFNSNGVLDQTFGTKSSTMTDIGGAEWLVKMIKQPDEKILTIGYTTDGKIAIARFDANGNLDTSFGADGKMITSFSGDSWAAALSLQPDGKIVISGDVNDEFILARLNKDAAYHEGGTFFYNPNGQFDSLPLSQTAYDSFTYVVSDGVLTDTATVSITVEGATSVFLPVVGK
jgi:uncharacterized delta-60 repeat protein